MFDIDLTFLWTGINLLIIYYVVDKFLFKRLGAYMDKRSAGIAENIQRGEAAKAEGEQFLQQQAILLEETAAQQRAILKAAQDEAKEKYSHLVVEARKAAEQIKDEAKLEIARERENMKRELLDETAALAIAAASRIVEANMDSERNRQLAERFLRGKGAA